MTQMPDLDAPWATIQEAAVILNVSVATVNRMLADGRLTRHKLVEGRQGTVRISMDELLPPGGRRSRALDDSTTDTNESAEDTEDDR